MILDKLAESTKARVEKAKEKCSLDKMKELAMAAGTSVKGDFAFERALRTEDISFICEVKKASPSKGLIAAEFPYLKIAEEYEAAGAAAISVLTETEYFLGSDRYLTEISRLVKVPVIRKDFTIDEYQIYEAKVIGADAVLLICSLLDWKTIEQYISICDKLGLSALVEAHSEEETEFAKAAGARIIGVNNRNLKTFEVDIHNCTRLREKVPKDIIFVAESGIQTEKDISVLREAGVNAVLIGETLMKSPNKKAMISHLRGNLN